MGFRRIFIRATDWSQSLLRKGSLKLFKLVPVRKLMVIREVHSI